MIKKLFVGLLLISGELLGQDLTAKLIVPPTVAPGSTVDIVISINRANITGFMKLYQDLPAGGFTAKEIDSKGGAFSSMQNSSLKVVWIAAPVEPSYSVKYSLTIPENVTGQKSLAGKIFYVKDNERAVFDIPSATFTVTKDAPVANSKKSPKVLNAGMTTEAGTPAKPAVEKAEAVKSDVKIEEKEIKKVEEVKAPVIAEPKKAAKKNTEEENKKDSVVEEEEIEEKVAATSKRDLKENTASENKAAVKVEKATVDTKESATSVTPDAKKIVEKTTTTEKVETPAKVVEEKKVVTNEKVVPAKTSADNTEEKKTVVTQKTIEEKLDAAKAKINNAATTSDNDGTKTTTVTTEKVVSTEAASKSVSIVYKVQVGAYSTKPKVEDLKDVSTIKAENGVVKYYSGNFSTFEEALQHKEEILAKGYKDAFVVTFKDGKQIK